jgi:hypothetical protein
MAINLYSAAPPYGWANIIGKLFNCQKDINTSRGTTLVTDILNSITFFNTITANSALTQAFENTPTTIATYQAAGSGSVSALQQIAQQFTIAIVNNDKVQPDSSLKTALQYIITQMLNTAQSVNQSAVTIAVAAGSNTGNGVVLFSKKRGDGLVQENLLAESIAGTFAVSGLTSFLTLKGQQTASNSLGQDWPLGSGIGASLTSVDANTSSLLTNGGMETWNNQTNVPDNWIAAVATPGTTLKQTTLEVHQIVIAGSPTGTFTLTWTNQSSKAQTTAPIAFSGVSASTIQTALRALAGLGSVIVAYVSGTTPNITVTVTYNGAGGSQNLLTAVSNPSGASITITRTVTGTPQVFAGSYSVQYASNGAELTELRQLVPSSTLKPLTAYAVSLWACCDSVPAAGVVTIDLWDGSAVINDAQAVPNSITFNASALTTSFQHLNALQAAECAFRTPAVLPPLVYLRVRISTAITNTKSMFVDNVGLTAFNQIYSGGPLLALFSGNVAWQTNDTWTVTTTNNRVGVLREWCNRNFGMDALGLLFPTSGAPTIPDSVVS